MPRPPKGMFRRGKSWYMRLRDGYRDKWVSLGPDFKEAKSRFWEIMDEGDVPVKITVANAVERWLETYIATARNERGQELARRRAQLYLLPALGHRMLRDVRKDDLRGYRLWLEKQGKGPQTVSHVLSDARCMFRWAEDAGYIDVAPVPRRLLPRIQERPPDRLTDEETEAVCSTPDPYGFICRFGVGTGLRWGEMTRALTSDIQRGSLVVYQTKTSRLRRVPLPPDLQQELVGRVGQVVQLRHAGNVARVVRRLSGVERFHVHQLRHTFACRWVEKGGNITALQEVLGHTSLRTTQRYARPSDEVVAREARRVFEASDSVATSVANPPKRDAKLLLLT